MPTPRPRVVRDPVHGYVDVPGELGPLVATPAVQRLRHIAQTARAAVRYPSLTGTRYEHALGTMHLALRGWREAWQNCSPAAGETQDQVRAAFVAEVVADLGARDDADPVTAAWLAQVTAGGRDGLDAFAHGIGLALGAVGLLHDVGHPPYSHILEPFYAARVPEIFGESGATAFEEYEKACAHGAQFHEWAGLAILDRIPDEAFAHLPRLLVRRLLADRTGAGWADALHGLVDGQFDVDRLDYLMRDADRAGTEFGSIDHERLLSSLELHRSPARGWAIGLGARAISAFETLLVQRAQLYRWVNHHHAVVAADTALRRCVSRLHDLSVRQLPAEGEADPAVLEPLARLRIALPELDYVTAATATGQPVTEDGAVADDHGILGWLRRAAPALHRLAAQDTDPDLARTARIALSLQGIADGLVAAVPAWRNHQEFLARAEQNPDAVRSVVAAVPPPAVPGHLVTPAGRNAYAALLEEDCARLNEALDVLLLAGGARVEDAEAALDAAIPEVPGQGPGYWLLARLPFLAVKEEFATVWRGNDETPLSAVSPFPLALTAIEVMRPRWMAFFVPFGTVPDDTDKHARREVGRALLTALAARTG